MTDIHYAYLHGFASSPLSRKGQALEANFAEHGETLHLPDLNQPSFAELTLTRALWAVDELAARFPRGKWRFIGSSMGGWIAARWAELHPKRVDRLLLLCPGFDLVSRWPQMLGERQMKRWEANGSLPFPDATGNPVRVHWGLIEDAREQPAFPEVPCATVIVHGTSDEVVPVEISREYASERDHVSLVEVDDEHALTHSVPLIAEVAAKHFVLG